MYPTRVRRLRPKPPADSEPPAARVALDSTREAERRMKQAQAIVEAAIAMAQSDGIEPKDRAAALEIARKALADQETIARGEPTRRLERALQAAGGPVGALAALSRSTAATAPTLAAVQGRSRRRGVLSAQKQAELDAGRAASIAAGAPIYSDPSAVARAMVTRASDPSVVEMGLKAVAATPPTQGFGAGPAGLGAPSDTETARAQAIEARAAEEPYPST